MGTDAFCAAATLMVLVIVLGVGLAIVAPGKTLPGAGVELDIGNIDKFCIWIGGWAPTVGLPTCVNYGNWIFLFMVGVYTGNCGVLLACDGVFFCAALRCSDSINLFNVCD